MNLSQRKLYRFWQQARGAKQLVTLEPENILLEFNQQFIQLDYANIKSLTVKKGWWFSSICIELKNDKTLILDGYLYSALRAFRKNILGRVLNYYNESLDWQDYLSALRRLESKQHYFSSHEWQPLVELYSLAAQFTSLNIKANDIKHPLANQVFALAKKVNLSEISETARTAHNQLVVARLLAKNKAFFDVIEKQKLTQNQRQACVTNDDHTLVIAGAGTGKTATLIGKAGFLIQAHLARPAQILMLAFGQKAALEMNERIQARLNNQAGDLKASTFHALGFEIVCQAQKAKKQPELKLSPLSSNASLLADFISDSLVQNITDNLSYKRMINEYCHHQFSKNATDVPEDIHTQHWQWRALVSLIIRFLTLYKEGDYSLANMQNLLAKKDSKDFDENYYNLLFLKIFQPLLQAYQLHLSQNNEIDFADMILLAIEAIESGDYQTQYRYILVDEFQDISNGRVKLLTALLGAHPNVRLFAVGDDWQAIYRFNGADLTLFTQFNQYFSPSTQIALDKTFRFNNKIHDISSQFISENPAQIPKKIKTHQQQNSRAVHLIDVSQLIANPTEYVTQSIEQAYQSQLTYLLTELNQQAQASALAQSVLLIGRFSKAKMQMFKSFNIQQHQYAWLDIRYVTAHASKGLEADHAIIIEVDDRVFPSNRKTEAVLEMVLPSAEHYLHAEERRLFYVAMTRAKHQVFLLYNARQMSCFIDELQTFFE
ncbi:UvrD-helicase domain-containing protein [Catenovulum adriaticum]|uniref:DNA 3'-5' helicase n=1 Tax=Catenovulum adriaticum TaxID=2984846 RepID=A0ABY7AUV3_9ALTE|nr:UvrD-helicase domain-containing protein [Catenovulum sp. TS8]WAJ72295.1 UvrD-helicase domain-containing protein [Catenovulum sp. TS8]